MHLRKGIKKINLINDQSIIGKQTHCFFATHNESWLNKTLKSDCSVTLPLTSHTTPPLPLLRSSPHVKGWSASASRILPLRKRKVKEGCCIYVGLIHAPSGSKYTQVSLRQLRHRLGYLRLHPPLRQSKPSRYNLVWSVCVAKIDSRKV